MEGEKLSYNGISLKDDCASVSNVEWVLMETGNGISDTESVVSCDEDSISSSVSSDNEEDDATSSSSYSPSAPGPLYELSKLMDHLPIKRGLSNQGMSQYFPSLGSVKILEDLAKKESPYRKKAKTCYNRYGPNAIITKKSCSRSSKGTFVSSLGKRSSTFVSTSRCNVGLPFHLYKSTSEF